jgi:hypothetical protein
MDTQRQTDSQAGRQSSGQAGRQTDNQIIFGLQRNTKWLRMCSNVDKTNELPILKNSLSVRGWSLGCSATLYHVRISNDVTGRLWRKEGGGGWRTHILPVSTYFTTTPSELQNSYLTCINVLYHHAIRVTKLISDLYQRTLPPRHESYKTHIWPVSTYFTTTPWELQNSYLTCINVLYRHATRATKYLTVRTSKSWS